MFSLFLSRTIINHTTVLHLYMYTHIYVHTHKYLAFMHIYIYTTLLITLLIMFCLRCTFFLLNKIPRNVIFKVMTILIHEHIVKCLRIGLGYIQMQYY